MARLPTVADFGARPTPQAYTGSPSTVPNAGGVAQAAGQLGETVARIGQGIVEKEDKLNYAAARTKMLTASITARQELQNDPDYETWGKRFTEKMKAAQGEAEGMIRSASDRRMFQADAEVDTLRGGEDLAKLVTARRVNARLGVYSQTKIDLMEASQNAPDDATREATINTFADATRAAVAQGDISASDGVAHMRDFGATYVSARVETLRTMDDLDGAKKFLDMHRQMVDPGTEVRLYAQLHDALENRDNLGVVDHLFTTPTPADATGKPTAARADIGRMASITAQSESGNKDRVNGQLVTSPKGAQGRMQVMPGTARDPGHGIRPWDGKSDDDRARVGTELLAALTRKYGDPAKAWAAYNWGEAKVDAAVSKHGGDWLAHTPDETKAYVAKNMAALGGGTTYSGPSGPDMNTINARIDDMAKTEGWSPERKAKVRAMASARGSGLQAEANQARQENFNQALAKADTLGGGFTDVSQLGDNFYKADAQDQHRLRAMAEANMHAQAAGPPANGSVVRSLHVMAIAAPDQFAQANLAQYRPFMTSGEFDEVSQSQARAKTQDQGGWNPRSGIQSAIGWGKTFGGVDLNDDDLYRVYRFMEARAREHAATNHGKPPTENDYQGFFREATREVQVTRSFMGVDALASDTTSRAYELPSAGYKALITRQFKAQFGRNPTDAEVHQWFDRMGEKLK